jgi:hypothetical protein
MLGFRNVENIKRDKKASTNKISLSSVILKVFCMCFSYGTTSLTYLFKKNININQSKLYKKAPRENQLKKKITQPKRHIMRDNQLDKKITQLKKKLMRDTRIISKKRNKY